MNLSKVAKTNMSYLQNLYHKGITGYPRTENDLFRKTHDMLPHPKLFEYGPNFLPIKETDHRLTKKSALFFLSYVRIMSPANIENFAATIEKYFTDTLSFKSRALKKEGLDFVYELKGYMVENKLLQEDIVEINASLYSESKRRKYAISEIVSLRFIKAPKEESRIRKLAPRPLSTIDKTQKRKEDELRSEMERRKRVDEYYSAIIRHSSLRDALVEFRRIERIRVELESSKEAELAIAQRTEKGGAV